MTPSEHRRDRLIAAATQALNTHPAMPPVEPRTTYALAVTVLDAIMPEHDEQVRAKVADEARVAADGMSNPDERAILRWFGDFVSAGRS